MRTRRTFLKLAAGVAAVATLAACASPDADRPDPDGTAGKGEQGGQPKASQVAPRPSLGSLQEGSRTDRGFVVDDLLQDTPAGEVHFSLHVPDSYDGTRPYALYVHCPGWEGLWFQGVGAHLVEDFPFVANDYVADMIVASPQLDDWGETSAQKTIALTEWLLSAYNIDPSQVFLSGYSGGGETISHVLGMRPELYRRALHASSQWDGDTSALVKAKVPVRLSIGESDDYYGSEPVRRIYEEIRTRYQAQGLTEGEIGELVVLDIKPASYFEGQAGDFGQHGGGAVLFPHDPQIMGWLFS